MRNEHWIRATIRGAVTEDDNRTVSPVFLAVGFTIYVVMPLVIVLLATVAIVDVIVNHHEASIVSVGGGIAAVIGAVGALVTGLAVVLRQDKRDP
jgi:hypothetical protein